MTVTQEQIEKLSKKLSKINITSEKNEKFGNDMIGILKYVELLGEVDTTNVHPTINVVQKENVLRKDERKENTISRESLLGCSNQAVIQDQIAISNIM